MFLNNFWFLVIGVLWIGYFILEGFDFGVGALLRIVGKDEKGRRVLINTIGPIWDGNEVWVVSAGAFTFAAFPEWYASMFSAFYLALLLILVCLIVRGVAFEYRGKGHSDSVAGPLGLGDPDHLVGAGAALGGGVRQHRPRRRAGRRPRVRRQLPRPAEPVRAADRAVHAGAVHHPRRRSTWR